MKKKLFWLSSLAVVFALLITSTGFAEGEEPQAPAAEVPNAPAEPAAQPAVPAAAAVEAAPAAAEAALAPVLTEAPAAITETPPAAEAAPLVEQSAPAPAVEAQVVAVDSAGKVLDMASQASAEVLASSDPYFKVGTVIYRFSKVVNYCSNNYPGDTHCFDPGTSYPVTNPIQDTINYIQNYGTIPPDGKIYV
jgi:hypothetical protein